MHIINAVSDLQLLHFTVEAALAAFVGLLYRRLEGVRAQFPAVEAAQEKAKRRSEAASGGLHMRLLTVERHLRQAHAAAQAAPTARRAGSPETAAPATVAVPKGQLTRGELDLFLKVRQMNGKEG